MVRRKFALKKAIKVSLVLEEEHFECVKQAALQLSAIEGRLITPSEAMRIALNKCYPATGSIELEKKSFISK